MTTREAPLERPTARVLLLDGAGRVLLFESGLPDGRPGRLWYAPGGGLEPGESWEAAARRELIEETGCDVAIGPCVWLRAHTWYFATRGLWIRSVERYFVARSDGPDIRTDGWTAAERQIVAGWRWWTADELTSTRDVVAPRRLGTLLAPIVAGELPAAPFDVGE